MSEFVAERFLNQLKQNFESYKSREPHRGHRTRHLSGGRMNRWHPMTKRSWGEHGEGVLCRGPSRVTSGANPVEDNPYSGLPDPSQDLGSAVGEFATDMRFNLVATNNVSLQRDFFGLGPDLNADALASSGPSNVSYAPVGTPQKPTVYDIYIPALGAVISPNPITYLLLGLRDFNPALPVTIVGQVENEDNVGGGKGFRQPLPPVPPIPIPLILEVDLMPTGWNGVTYDTGFYYIVWLHDYIAGVALDVTQTTPVHFHIIGYEG